LQPPPPLQLFPTHGQLRTFFSHCTGFAFCFAPSRIATRTRDRTHRRPPIQPEFPIPFAEFTEYDRRVDPFTLSWAFVDAPAKLPDRFSPVKPGSSAAVLPRFHCRECGGVEVLEGITNRGLALSKGGRPGNQIVTPARRVGLLKPELIFVEAFLSPCSSMFPCSPYVSCSRYTPVYCRATVFTA